MIDNPILCIHPKYRGRTDPTSFDDRNQRDEWQDAVYARAREIALKNNDKRILDIGCGSGFKLMKYFSGFETVGYELEPTLSFLKTTYPNRVWLPIDHELPIGDMIICADVVEHLANPVALLQRFAKSSVRTIILSTPALEILDERGWSPRFGPPDNTSHLVEWTTREFKDFVEMHLTVIEHTVIDARQGTQMIVAQPRDMR